MKLRLIALLLCLAMLFSLSLSLVSCGDNGDNGEGTGENEGGNTGGENEGGNTGGENEGGNTGGENEGENDGGNTGDEGTEPLPPYSVVESFLPASISEALYSNFVERNSKNGYTALMKANGAYAYLDTATISNCKIVSITIPVMKVTNAVEGKHTFTIFKVKSSAKGLMSAPLATYKIVIDAADYGLSTKAVNNVYTVIDINLLEYNITLGEGETLAFVGKDDTLLPAYIKDDGNPMDTALRANLPEATGAFFMVGDTTKDSYRAVNYSLCFNLELLRTYENVEVYNEMVAKQTAYQKAIAALKELYAGKKISILGDSISTYAGVSNDKTANSTTSGHSVYYPNYDNSFSSYTETYWGRLMTDLGMQLCVNNSWAGARVMGKSGDNNSINYRDRMTYRATELDRDDGTLPDVIIAYMGINDVKDVPVGDLYSLLERKTDTRTDDAKVAEWFAAVLANAGNMPYARSSYDSFDEAYALGLYTMRQKYPDAEVYCMTLIYNHSGHHDPVNINKYNRVIKAVAQYLGVTVVDQSGEFSPISYDNIHCYGTINADLDCVHLSSTGHKMMEQTILLTMARKNGLL